MPVRSLIISTIAALLGLGVGHWFLRPSAAVPTDPPKPAPPTANALATPDQPKQGSDGALKTKPLFTGTLHDALGEMNPLSAAQRVEAWLARATAADFAALAQDPSKFPNTSFNAFQHEFRDAFNTAFLTRWLELDPNASDAILRIHASMGKSDNYDATEFMKAVARVRPQLVLEKAKPEFATRKHLTQPEFEAIQELARRDVDSARSFGKTLPEVLQPFAEAAIIRAIAERDPLAALAMAKTQNPKPVGTAAAIIAAAERIGPGVLRQVFAHDDGLLDSSPDLQRLLLKYPDLARDIQPPAIAKPPSFHLYIPDDLLHQADVATPEERTAALARYEEMPAETRDSVAAALVASWARTEPKEAATWALAHARFDEANASGNQAAHFAFLRWIQTDRAAALDWFRALPASPLRDAMGTNASTYLAEDGDLKVAQELNRPTADKNDRYATAHLVQLVAERDPAAAAEFLARAPESGVSSEAISALLHEWYPQDKEATAQWIESLPPGTRRDEALKNFATKVSRDSPEAAAAWTETIADQRLRQQAAGWTFYALKRENPGRALEWIRNLPGVDDAWRSRLLRRP